MKKLWFILLLFCVGCQPQFQRKWNLQYEVIKQTPEPITYSVHYTTANGATKSQGPFTDTNWKSELMENVAIDFDIELEVKVISGSATLELRVLRDGATHKSDVLEPPILQQKITTKL